MIFIYILSKFDRTTRYGSRVFNDQNYEVVFAEAHVKLILVRQTARANIFRPGNPAKKINSVAKVLMYFCKSVIATPLLLHNRTS